MTIGSKAASAVATMRPRRLGRKGLIAAATAGLVVAGGGVAFATQVAANSPITASGVIHGCYTTQAIQGSHALELRNVGRHCPKGTTAITWNQKGPQGPAGKQGPPGKAGPVNEVTGAVNSNCTLQGSPPASIVSVTEVASGECRLTFGSSVFSGTPILILTPIDSSSGNATGIGEGRNPDGTWYAQYSFAGPTLVNFIASQFTN